MDYGGRNPQAAGVADGKNLDGPNMSTDVIKPQSIDMSSGGIHNVMDILSKLTVGTRNFDQSDRSNLVNPHATAKSAELTEKERQELVETDRHRKVVALSRALVQFGAENGIMYITYGGEDHLKEIMDLITRDLSEPYSIYTYRYFIYQWPKLCHLAVDQSGKIVGVIVCKMENSKGPLGRNDIIRRGYIAMLAVDTAQRRKRIGTALVVGAVESLMNNDCDEVVLETEITNHAALRLYENLGFARHKRLLKYYLNGVDAFRLKLWLRFPVVIRERSRMSLSDTIQSDLKSSEQKLSVT